METSVTQRGTFSPVGFFFLFVGLAILIMTFTCSSAESQSSSKTPEITIYPKRTAVLVLHMMNEQLSYKPGVSNYGPEFAEDNKKLGIIEHTKAVLDASREKGILVVYVRQGFRPGYPELPPQEELIPVRRRLREQGFYKDGTWNTQIVDELKPMEKDVVVNNHTPSAFGSNDLDMILHSNNIRYLILTGLSTKTVVTGTTIDAYSKMYYNYVLKDCCNSRGGKEEQEFYMKEVLPSFAVIIDSGQYIRALEKIKK